MTKLVGLILGCAVLVCFGVSCEKIETSSEGTSERTSLLTDIPAEYGELEAVTAVPEYPGWYQLWFEDNAGTIRMVRVHLGDDLIHNTVDVIPRSGAAGEEATEDEG